MRPSIFLSNQILRKRNLQGLPAPESFGDPAGPADSKSDTVFHHNHDFYYNVFNSFGPSSPAKSLYAAAHLIQYGLGFLGYFHPVYF